MKKIFALFLPMIFFVQPAIAQTKIGDWVIEKRAKDVHCNASYGYKDAGDDHVIVLTYSDAAIVFVLIYDGWRWNDATKIQQADFGTEQSVISEKSKWQEVDRTTLRGIFKFDASVFDSLSKAKILRLDFGNDQRTDFKFPDSAAMLGALKFCEENRK